MKTRAFYLYSLIFFVLISYSGDAQNAYYDALKIDFLEERINNSNNFILKDKNNYDLFISNPFDNPLNEENLNSIRENIIFDEFGRIGFSSTLAILGEQSLSSTGSSLFSIPTSAQSAIIDGTAKFLAERFKEDITTLYIEKFRKRLDSIEELRELLPKTYDFLNTADVFNYRSLGNDFKDAFEVDLKNILENLGNYINANPKLLAKLKAKKVYYPFDFTLSLSDKLINGYHPVEILDYLDSKYKNHSDSGFQNYYNVVHGLNIIQQNLQRRKKQKEPNDFNIILNEQFKNIWLRFSDLKELDSPKKVNYFVALIYNQDKNYFKEVLKIDTTKAQDFFRNTIYPIVGVLNTIENIQSKAKNVTASDYVDIMENTLKLLKLVNSKEENSFKLGTFSTSNHVEDDIDVLEFMGKMIDLYKSIHNKNYGYIVTNSLYITDKVLLAGGKSQAEIIKVTQAISKYGGFMVDIVTADNSDDVKDAIKKNVTKFSFLDKRNSLFSLSISAHPGVYGGIERLSENDRSETNIGITAPIGLEFMWGSRKAKKGNKALYPYVKKNGKVKYLSGNAWGIFVSFADLGAVFNYRLNDSENELPQEITFKQIFSPGISFNYGFRNSPITLAFGVQYTPELRKVTVEDIETSSNSVRTMLRLSWDIPLIKIYRKKVKN